MLTGALPTRTGKPWAGMKPLAMANLQASSGAPLGAQPVLSFKLRPQPHFEYDPAPICTMGPIGPIGPMGDYPEH
jgi:hypothetical protein